ncbi:Swt1 family HEPN domain-containing protein [Roseinatronobacter monicus]|uniref:Uncharacterized protein n=1 Tax=Roseinatronobacter monicus TaxID=393481 RepID=A0A543KCC1_9RHOB|nr:Swt1 family HEPN domain-containing protein [Roseinatronobacter monicus]TQM92687.1 hypothetical protein BD293_1303 [Roseinatronobacter monicus]
MRNLLSLADFEADETRLIKNTRADYGTDSEETANAPLPEIKNRIGDSVSKLNIGYKINLNLPETTDIEVFNAIFYCLEMSIRRLIRDTFVSIYGLAWWDRANVAVGIREEVKRNRTRERDSAITSRSDDPLDYTTFGQLSQLITDNFDLFEPVFDSKPAVGRVLNQLNLLRGPIAHCSMLAPDERGRLEQAVRDWFRLLIPISIDQNS